VLYHPYDPATCKNPSVLVGLDSLGRFLSVLRVGADLEKGKGGTRYLPAGSSKNFYVGGLSCGCGAAQSLCLGMAKIAISVSQIRLASHRGVEKPHDAPTKRGRKERREK